MSLDENKAVVRQFITNVLIGHDVDMVDKLVAVNYVNRSMGNSGKAAFKAMISAMKSASIVSDIEIEDLIAEGDSVVFRGRLAATPANGTKVIARGMTFYRLANGKIVEDDPVFVPDLSQILGNIMPPKSGP